MLEKSFATTLDHHGLGPLARGRVETLQVNVGKLCNQACHHCHVDAGPKRTEIMTEPTARRVVDVLAASPTATTVDITGGAPELNPHFRRLVHAAHELGARVSRNRYVIHPDIEMSIHSGMPIHPHHAAEKPAL